MSDEARPERSPTAMEISDFRSRRLRGTAIIVGIIIISVVGGTAAYFYLKPTPCEIVTSDLCGFLDMTGPACAPATKAIMDLGATEAWCSEVIAGKEELEPEMISGHYFSSLDKLLEPAIERHDTSGTEPPELLLKMLEKVNPVAANERRVKVAARDKAPAQEPPDGGPATQDGGGDGQP